MSIELPIEHGDILLGGKFKNKKIVVKDIGKDEYGDPTVNGRSILNVRLVKKKTDDEMDRIRRIVSMVIRGK